MRERGSSIGGACEIEREREIERGSSIGGACEIERVWERKRK